MSKHTRNPGKVQWYLITCLPLSETTLFPRPAPLVNFCCSRSYACHCTCTTRYSIQGGWWHCWSFLVSAGRSHSLNKNAFIFCYFYLIYFLFYFVNSREFQLAWTGPLLGNDANDGICWNLWSRVVCKRKNMLFLTNSCKRSHFNKHFKNSRESFTQNGKCVIMISFKSSCFTFRKRANRKNIGHFWELLKSS